MKTFVVAAVLVAISLAEPPPSNSYLPPSTRGGYPQAGGPQGSGVIAARSQGLGLEHGVGAHGAHGAHGHGAGALGGSQGIGFARSGLNGGHGSHGAHGQGQGLARFGQEPGYDHNAAAFGRNALDAASEPANYNFGYMVNDYQEGTDFGHHEERQEERAQGEYHVVLPDGRKQTVSYEADERGFKPIISYEDTEASGRSGYDSNAGNTRSGHGSFANGGHGNHGNARSGGY